MVLDLLRIAVAILLSVWFGSVARHNAERMLAGADDGGLPVAAWLWFGVTGTLSCAFALMAWAAANGAM